MPFDWNNLSINPSQIMTNVLGLLFGKKKKEPEAWEQYQQPLADMTTQYLNLLGQPSNVASWTNPYAGMMNRVFSGMEGAPTSQQAASQFAGAFGPMMQSGGGINWNDPKLAETQMPGSLSSFLGMQVAPQMQFGAPAMGAGGRAAQDIAGGTMPSGANAWNFNMTPTMQARQAQLQGLLGAAQKGYQPVVDTEAIARGIIEPTAGDLAKQYAQSQSLARAAGLGRSSAVTGLAGDYQGQLSNLGAQARGKAAEIAAQYANTPFQNQMAALNALGAFAGQGMDYDIAGRGLSNEAQQLANAYALGRGNLGLGLEQINQTGQQWAGEMNQAARTQRFNELAQQAGLGADIYQSDAARALQQYLGEQQYGLGKAGMEQTERQTADQNLLALLGMGQTGAAQDFGQRAQLLQSLLGAGGLSQDAWRTMQDNLLREEASRYGLSLPGQTDVWSTLFGGTMGWEQFQDQLALERRRLALAEKEAQGGGFWDTLAGLAPLGLYAIPGIGPVAGTAATAGQRVRR